jgi:hypothetical protein
MALPTMAATGDTNERKYEDRFERKGDAGDEIITDTYQ